MFDKELIKKIETKYNIDISKTAVEAKIVDIVFCFDMTKRGDSEICFVRGDYSKLGIFKDKKPTIKEFFKYLEIDNPVSQVYGRDGYVDRIIHDLNTLDSINEFYLPFRKNGILTWLCLSLASVTKEAGQNKLVCGKINWMSEKTPRAIRYYQSRYKDAATGLFTKESLSLHLSMTRKSDHSYGLFFDIDNFKRINDVFGHKSGDKYLKELADKLISNFEEDVIYYRLGGDEFFVYIKNCTEETAYRRALDVIYTVETLNPEGQQVEVSASVGIVPIIGDSFDFETLVDLADKTMYFSKRKGKGYISYAREV